MIILKKIYEFFVDFVETIAIAGAIFVVVYAFLFRPFQVNGESMYPNYHNGEYILTNLITLRISDIERGDVVVFNAPIDEDKDFIKRVIGVPGDKVAVENGKIILNGKVLDESEYLDPSVYTEAGPFSANQTITVQPGTYFVVGDNRPNSSDSRAWGLVPQDKLIGKSMFVYWPLNRMRVVKHVSIGE